MSIHLKTWTGDPKNYVDVIEHNLQMIGGIENDAVVDGFIKSLSEISSIDYQICLLDLKAYLMYCISYSPDRLDIKPKNSFLSMRYLASNLFHGFKPQRLGPADVIIDDWTAGIVPAFYGGELIGRLAEHYQHKILNLNKYKTVRVEDIFRFFGGVLRSMFLANKIIKKHKIDLRPYVFAFFSDFLSGLMIRRLCRTRLIITGNQNGFSSIKARAAGAEILLIPNGVFGYFPDTSFKYADYFISIGGKSFVDAALKFGCVFKSIYEYGPLRIYNFTRKTKGRCYKVIYDLLWVGCGSNVLYDAPREGYTIAAEHAAVKLINEYAARKDVKVAYHCRYDYEVDRLKNYGLFSENIEYLPPTYSEKTGKTKNIYEAVMESKIIMSSLSGVCHEAFSLGKKFAFINISGNAYLNYPYRNAGVEYTPDMQMSFGEFVEEIKTRQVAPDEYVSLNPDYVEDLLAIVAGVGKTIK